MSVTLNLDKAKVKIPKRKLCEVETRVIQALKQHPNLDFAWVDDCQRIKSCWWLGVFNKVDEIADKYLKIGILCKSGEERDYYLGYFDFSDYYDSEKGIIFYGSREFYHKEIEKMLNYLDSKNSGVKFLADFSKTKELSAYEYIYESSGDY